MPSDDSQPIADLTDFPLPVMLEKIVKELQLESITTTDFDSGGRNGKIFSGTLTSLLDDPLDVGIGRLHLPGLTTGVPARLVVFDEPFGACHLDVLGDGFALELDGLVGADLQEAVGTTPRRLIRRTADTEVVITGEAVVRFTCESITGPVNVMFVDHATADDPTSVAGEDTGGVARLEVSPPHFFVGTSQFGVTVREMLFDFSATYSPQFITDLGETPEWTGFAITEATVYTPPNALGKGEFSAGVNNLLIGSPRGIRGEVEVQWGRTPLAPERIQFIENGEPPSLQATGEDGAYTLNISATGDHTVEIGASLTADATPEGSPVEAWGATWIWPGQSRSEGTESSGTVRDGDTLTVIPYELLDDGRTLTHPAILFTFVGTRLPLRIVTKLPPLNGEEEPPEGRPDEFLDDVVYISGPAKEIAELTFSAYVDGDDLGDAEPDTTEWHLCDQDDWDITELEVHEGEPGDVDPRFGGTRGGSTSVVKIPLDLLRTEEQTDDGDIRYTYFKGTVRVRQSLGDIYRGAARAKIVVTADEPLAIGAGLHAYVADDVGASVTEQSINKVHNSYDLQRFHLRGRTDAAGEGVTVSADGAVTIPDGLLARVSVLMGDEDEEEVTYDRHVQVRYPFDQNAPPAWGEQHPAAAGQPGSTEGLARQLLEWANNYPGAQFLIVGRCDDLGSDAYNVTLAQQRAETAVRLLTTSIGDLPGIDPSRIISWGEQDGQPSGVADSPLTDAEQQPVRLVEERHHEEIPEWPTTHDTAHAAEEVRVGYRRADIYAVGGDVENPAIATVSKEETEGDLKGRYVYVTGERTDALGAANYYSQGDYRVKLLVGWQDPTSGDWSNLIPTVAEFEYEWRPNLKTPPPLGGKEVTFADSSEDYTLMFYGTWSHDQATGFTRAMLGLASHGDPDGLVTIPGPELAAALGLGPVLLSTAEKATGTIDGAARLTALAGGAGFALIPTGGEPLIGDSSSTTLQAIEASAEVGELTSPGGDWRTTLTADYTTTLDINAGALGLQTDGEGPVVLRFSGVGIGFDAEEENLWEKITLVYPPDSMQVQDPGVWSMDGALGDLLRVVESAVGTGSVWLEVRLAFALNIGVVEVSEAAVRVTFNDDGAPSASLRGLTAAIDIPATVRGQGSLNIDPDGVVSAAVDLDIVPLGLAASAALALATVEGPPRFTYVNLFAKVTFPTPVPLGPSGAALFGLVGQVVINGRRELPSAADPVTREIGWWNLDPSDKYAPEEGQHALGLGAVIGTLPDAGFSLSAQGMIAVAFPDPQVIFGVEVGLFYPRGTPSDSGGEGGAITGLVIIDDEAVTLAVSAQYEIPGLIAVQAPISAHFPYSGAGTYVRIGSDGEPGREGGPVTYTLLPGTLDLGPQGYLMVEQDGLENLGGVPQYSFEGFSVGFGALAEIDWRAGWIGLHGSVTLLAGVGLDPLFLRAGMIVKAEIDLGVVSLGVSGEIAVSYLDRNVWLEGEFCGRIRIFFVTISGCVDFRLGSEPRPEVAPPPPPIASVSLTDRGGRVMGEAAMVSDPVDLLAAALFAPTNSDAPEDAGVDPSKNNTVWPDTVPVLNLRHPADMGSLEQFEVSGPSPGAAWFGSNRLQYAYRIVDVRLKDSRGQEVVPVEGSALAATWVTSPVRPSGGQNPSSGSEVQSLKLLDWSPWDWALPMSDGGASAAADPASEIAKLCEELPSPEPTCVFGVDSARAGRDHVRFSPADDPESDTDGAAAAPYGSRFSLRGGPGLRSERGVEGPEELLSRFQGAGATVLPGEIEDLPAPSPGPEHVDRGYRLPRAQQLTSTGLATTSVPWVGSFSTTVREGSVLLLVRDGVLARNATRFPTVCEDLGKVKVAPRQVPLKGYTLTPLDAGDPLGQSEAGVLIPGSGAHLEVGVSAAVVDLHFDCVVPGAMRFVIADVNGETHEHSEACLTPGPAWMRMVAAAPIAEVHILPAGGEVSLTQVCAESRQCLTIPDVPTSPFRKVARPSVNLQGMAIRSTSGKALAFTEATPKDAGGSALVLPGEGLEIIPEEPWASATVGVIARKSAVIATGYDSSDRVVASAQASDSGTAHLHLHGAVPLARVSVEGQDGALWQVCHTPVGEKCVGMGTQEGRTRTESELDLPGITIRPAVAGEDLELTVLADSDDSHLRIPPGGLAITPEAEVGEVTIHTFFGAEGEYLEAVAVNAAGDEVDKSRVVSTGSGTTEALTVQAEGIAQVIVLPTTTKPMITRVCTAPGSNQMGGEAVGLPVVSTHTGGEDGAMHEWPPEVLAEGGSGTNRWRMVAYSQPTNLAEVNGFDIASPTGAGVTLVSVCAITASAARHHEQDQTAQEHLRASLNDAALAAPASGRRDILLTPGESYQVDVEWAWQAWEYSADDPDSTQTPPGTPPEDEWIEGEKLTHYFRVAKEERGETGSHDGLNEHVFDPQDLAHYLDHTEPADGRNVVFTSDPLWAHFTAGHVHSLASRYGRGLELEVVRTDPPPQDSPAELDEAMAVPVREELRAWAPTGVASLAEQRINDAAALAECLPSEPVMGGVSIGGQFDLEPLAMYDLNVLAPGEDDVVVVHATRFTTSRYADPTEMMHDLGFPAAGMHPLPAFDLVLPEDGLELPTESGGAVFSDAEFALVLEQIGADTLPLPDAGGRTIVLWARSGVEWRVAGVLLDAPEPLHREGAILEGDRLVEGVRCTPEAITIGHEKLTPARATFNSTRMLFTPPQPTPVTDPGPDGEPETMTLHLHVRTPDPSGADSEVLEGRRVLPPRPVVVQTEGFS